MEHEGVDVLKVFEVEGPPRGEEVTSAVQPESTDKSGFLQGGKCAVGQNFFDNLEDDG